MQSCIASYNTKQWTSIKSIAPKPSPVTKFSAILSFSRPLLRFPTFTASTNTSPNAGRLQSDSAHKDNAKVAW